MANSIVNALKRLERAGSENSRATQKLFEAASKVAEFIEENVPVGVPLPRGYEIVERRSNVGHAKFLINSDEEYVDGTGTYLYGDFRCWIPPQKRRVVLDFAEDIATSLLDEIVDFIEDQAKESFQAAEVFEKSIT